MTSPRISIVIRTFNEERWIGLCLEEVFSQTFTDFEVIIVDNKSTDGTLSKVKKFPVKILSIEKYFPGLSLNLGIRESKGEIIVILSGHCIPANKEWLHNLIRNFDDKNVAGVYGRQLPMSFSSPQNKRDLLITFGLDRRIHEKDTFFHNANSAIRKSVWEKFNFDESVTNIEDRIWAKQVLSSGFVTIYDPESPVYHHHGIHHNDDPSRMTNTIKVIEDKNIFSSDTYGVIEPSKTKIIAIIPHVGENLIFDGQPIIVNAIKSARECSFVEDVVILTDNNDVAEASLECGASVPFLRESEHSKDYFDLSMVYSHYLDKLEEVGYDPEVVISLEPSYLFRPKGIVENCIKLLLSEGYDSVVPVIKEFSRVWLEEGHTYSRVDTGNYPKSLKKPLIRDVKGICLVTHSEFLRSGRLMGENCGLYQIKNQFASLKFNSQEEIDFYSKLLTK